MSLLLAAAPADVPRLSEVTISITTLLFTFAVSEGPKAPVFKP